jgi:hypothetical protein
MHFYWYLEWPLKHYPDNAWVVILNINNSIRPQALFDHQGNRRSKRERYSLGPNIGRSERILVLLDYHTLQVMIQYSRLFDYADCPPMETSTSTSIAVLVIALTASELLILGVCKIMSWYADAIFYSCRDVERSRETIANSLQTRRYKRIGGSEECPICLVEFGTFWAGTACKVIHSHFCLVRNGRQCQSWQGIVRSRISQRVPIRMAIEAIIVSLLSQRHDYNIRNISMATRNRCPLLFVCILREPLLLRRIHVVPILCTLYANYWN